MGRVSIPVNVFFQLSSGRNRRTIEDPAVGDNNKPTLFARACLPLPLSEWTGTSFEAPVRREWSSRRGSDWAQPLFCIAAIIS